MEMKGKNFLVYIGIIWAAASVALTVLLTNKDQGVAGILFEGVLWFSLCLLAPLGIGVIFLIAYCMTNKEGRAMLTELAEESQRRRMMKKAHGRGVDLAEEEETTIIGASEAGWENIEDGGIL